MGRHEWSLSFLGSVGVVLLTVGVIGCSSSSDESALEAPKSAPNLESSPLDLEIAMQLLSPSWMQQAAADPGKVTELIDAPGGEGWLKLFHGDLAGAEALFLGADPMAEPRNKGSARAGQARVHLARARSLLRVASLQSDAAAALVRYREEHRGDVRQGPYERVLSRLVLQAVGETVASSAGETPVPIDSAPYQEALEALLVARASAAPAEVAPSDLDERLPALYRMRLRFVHAISVGDVENATTLLPSLLSGTEDVTDPLGADSETGVTFQSLYFDPEVPQALARYHLARAWFLGAGLDGPGEAIALAVQQSWGGPVPKAVRNRTLPSAGPQPDWLALFLGPAIDRADWASYWGEEGDGRSFLAVLQDQMPAVPWLDGANSAAVDVMLRTATQIEPTVRAALIQSVGSEGASLSQDLGFAATTLDRLLRTRMMGLLLSGNAVLAKRLGERSLDAEPTRLGGAPTSAATRVSFRNDRAFLVDLARCLWKAGQVDAALSYVHPLSEEDPQLRGLAYYLGQLDAARSIRVHGKTTQR